MRWVWLGIGGLAVLAGIVWTLQGLSVLGGSVMSGNHTFVVIGPVVAVIGLALLAVGARQKS